jgi:hypothetical protein
MRTKPGTDMICDMIPPEGMSRPVGTAMQTKPGTDMICDMIRPEGMSRPEGTAMQTKPGKDVICDTICPEGTSRPVGTAIQNKPGTDMIRPEGMIRPSLQQALQDTLPSRKASVESQRATWASSLSRPRALQPNRRQRQAPLAAASAQDTLPRRQQVFGERGFTSCDMASFSN